MSNRVRYNGTILNNYYRIINKLIKKNLKININLIIEFQNSIL